MKKRCISAITFGSVLLLLIGSSSATVFNDGTRISRSDDQMLSHPFGALPEDNTPWVYAEAVKNLDPWKLILWFSLWIIAIFLWASIPVRKEEDRE